jgi:ribosomal protein S18 acetylase RimI-like enzyme
VLRLRPVRFTDRETQVLVSEVQAEYTLLYGSPDEAPVELDDFDPPQGAFFLGYVEGAAVAMGGWRLRSDVHPWGCAVVAEIKRMYVAPAARRRGHAAAVLAHLEQTAREAGAEAMVLETGTPQRGAIAMYQAAGYVLVESFGHYTWSPMSRCFGKPL